ncbi:hypothetical protein OUZ56_002991 [Daphnia magna]|uniref:Uncharacterized protein n=1 Tax=Daphnia magna TaxID=35525 RepID=A0ABR0A7E3_9CRUS|nr:hypothetical protein OUZ56_002991 [Daphnia magna]
MEPTLKENEDNRKRIQNDRSQSGLVVFYGDSIEEAAASECCCIITQMEPINGYLFVLPFGSPLDDR